MPGKFSVDTVLTDAAKIADVWAAHPGFGLGSIHLADLQESITQVRALSAGADSKRTELTGLMDQRDDATRALSEIVTRAKSGIRAIYGPDSPQYAQAGGVRRSERKAPTRRQPKPKAL